MTKELSEEEKKWFLVWDKKSREEIVAEAKNLGKEFLEKVMETEEKHFASYVLWLEFRAKHDMISKNYTLEDVTKSDTAFLKKIDNRPNKEAIINLN